MAVLKDVEAANKVLRNDHESVTAIFTGATQGVGLATLRTFSVHIPKPRAIIVGRNRRRFEDELCNLASLNPEGEFTFIEAEVSLIKSIDVACAQIKSFLDGASVDLLCMSPGYAPLQGREFTTEGLDKAMALVYYGRVRMSQRLIESGIMKPNAKIISVMAGSKEGKLFEDDLSLDRNYTLLNLRGQFATMMTISQDQLAAENPDMGFVHVFPGRVKTGLLQRSVQGWFLWALIYYLVEPLMFLGGITPEESGARILWMALGPEFDKGAWSLDFDGAESKSKWLAQYRQNGEILTRIAEHNQHVFRAATTE